MKELLRKRYIDPPSEDEQRRDEPNGEFSSLGEVREYDKVVDDAGDERFPELSFTVDQLPDLEKYEVGDDIILTVKATITGQNMADEGGAPARYQIKLTSAKIGAGA